jgi:ABC-type glycerol-3-phosphate transport system substrate-binding protein
MTVQSIIEWRLDRTEAWKKAVRIITTVLMLGVLFGIGCSRGGSSGTQTTSVTMLLLGDRPTNGKLDRILAEKINPKLREKVNAELKLQYIEWADWQNSYQLTLASGDPNIDLVTTGTDWLFAWEIARKGGFLGMTEDILKTNAPITWSEIPPDHWEVCSAGGKIWFIPEDQYTQFTNHGVYWRGDWAREAGITRVTNFTELEAYLDAVKKNHPEAIPYDVSGPNEDRFSGILEGYLQSRNMTQTLIGTITGNFNIFRYNINNPYTVISEYYEGQELIDAAIMFDRWAKKGFWREDVLNYTGDTAAALENGLSGLRQHHSITYYSAVRPTMDRLHPGSEMGYFYWGMENKNVAKDLITHGAMGINAASRNAEKALQVYDLLRNDKEIYQWYNFGIEGEDYILNADGTRGWPSGYDPDADNALGGNFWGGRNDRLEIPDENWWSGTSALVAELNSFAVNYPLEKFFFDNSAVAAEVAALGDACATYLPSITYGKTTDPVKAVADFRSALKAAGYEEVRNAIQTQLNAVYGR